MDKNVLSDPAAARIVTHMNADHQESLMRYLEHFHSVPSSVARYAYLINITLSYLSISISPRTRPVKGPLTPTNLPLDTTYTIPLDPPLASFAEARARVVALDQQCIAALGRDPITVKHYIPPRGADLVTTVAVVLTFALFYRRANLHPSTTPELFRPLLLRFPTAAAWLYWLQPRVVYPMLVVHAGEALWMDRTRLRRYSVPRGGLLWWKWMVGTFLGGFHNFIKLDKWVREERKRREKRAH